MTVQVNITYPYKKMSENTGINYLILLAVLDTPLSYESK